MSVNASAQGGSAEERMQTVSDAAMEKFQGGEFDQAAKGFEDAYKIMPQSVLMKNATVAWFSAGQCDEAERTAVAYLKDTKGDEKELMKDRRDVKTVVARCRLRSAKVAVNNDDLDGARESLDGIELYSPVDKDAEDLISVRKQIKAKQAVLDDAKKPDQTKKPDPKGDKSDNNTAVTPPPIVASAPGKGLLYAGWGLVGVGVVGGAIVTVDQMTLTNSCTPGPDCDKVVEDGNNRALIVGIGSGVVALTGATLLTIYYINKKEHEKSITLIPQLSRDQAGASILMRF